MFWDEKAECMNKEDKEKIQLERLQKTVKLAYENVDFYKKRFDEIGLKPEDIKTLKDIEKIPFTTKSDLRQAYPLGLLAVPRDEIVEIHASSGTTGKPTVTAYTQNDLEIWGECIARGLKMAGAEKDYIIQNAYGYGLFTGGFGIHHGGNKMGAITIPISAGNTQRQLDTMVDFQSEILTCTPSYAMYLGESRQKAGIPLEDINLKIGIHGAEMWTNEMRKRIEESLGIKTHNIYGLTEVMGPGVAQECDEQNGMHIQDDHFYPEIINPVTLEPLPKGQAGELVFTTLTKEGMPVLRYRTRDLCSLMDGECECGRTAVRMSSIKGRSDDMLIIRGINVFPSQVESVVLSMEEFAPRYMLIVDRVNNLDTLTVQVEIRQEYFEKALETIGEIAALEKKLAHRLQNVLSISAKVQLKEPNTIERSQGKSARVIDKRVLK